MSKINEQSVVDTTKYLKVQKIKMVSEFKRVFTVYTKQY